MAVLMSGTVIIIENETRNTQGRTFVWDGSVEESLI